MRNNATILALGLLGLALSAGCAIDDPDRASITSEAEQGLSTASWTGQVDVDGQTTVWDSAQVASLNGVTYEVSTGTCGAFSCNPDQDGTSLRWRSMTANNVWSARTTIPNQASDSKVNLAAFNGYLYMVHTGTSTSGQTWVSKFNPATGTWTANSLINGYPSYGGPPAIVAYNGLLYFIGTQSNGVMWWATMNTSDAPSAPTGIAFHTSTHRPSAAVINGVLYFTHAAGSGNSIVYGTLNGSTWSGVLHIPTGTSPDLTGSEAALATDQGVLHLIHTTSQADNAAVWWTYFDGCKWTPTEITIGTTTTSLPPSLTQGGPGLVMLTTEDNDGAFGTESREAYSSTYTHPRVIGLPGPPICNIGVKQ